MSENQANAEQQESKPEGEQVQKVDADELMNRLELLENSNKRLLDESKSWKAKYQGVRSEVEEKQTQQMAEANDFKGLYQKTLEQVNELKEEVKNGKRESLQSTLKYEVAKNARDASDPDLLLAAIQLKKKDLVGFDREAGTWKGVDGAIEELRKEVPGLFTQDKPGMVNGRPQSAVPKDKTVDEMILEDPNSVLNKALVELLR